MQRASSSRSSGRRAVSRRSSALTRLLATVAFLAVPLVLASCGGDDDESAATTSTSTSLEGENLTFVSFGGSLQRAEATAWLNPFAQETGADVQQDSPVDYAKIKAQVESGNVTWDVVEADAFFIDQQCGKLFEPIDRSAVDLSDVDQSLITSDCGLPVIQFGWVFMYDKSKYGNDPPTSWADFFNTTRYPGKRSLWNFTVNASLEAALLGDGVPPDQLYPMDLDRAIEKLDSIKDDIVFTDDLAQHQEQMLAGEYPMVLTVVERAYNAVKDGANYAPVWPQFIRTWDALGILKGSPNEQAAVAFLNYVARPEPQARVTEIIPSAPTTPDSRPDVSPLLNSYLPTNPERKRQSVPMDQQWWADHLDEATRRYTDWQAG